MYRRYKIYMSPAFIATMLLWMIVSVQHLQAWRRLKFEQREKAWSTACLPIPTHCIKKTMTKSNKRYRAVHTTQSCRKSSWVSGPCRPSIKRYCAHCFYLVGYRIGCPLWRLLSQASAMEFTQSCRTSSWVPVSGVCLPSCEICCTHTSYLVGYRIGISSC